MKNKKILPYFAVILVVFWIGHIITFKTYQPQPSKDGFPLTQKWNTKFGSNITSLIVAQDGTILVRTAYISAIDPKSSDLIWRILLRSQFTHSAGMEKNGILYITDDTALWAIRVETGEVIWKERISEVNLVIDLSDDLILLNSYGEVLSAHETKTGKILWSVRVGDSYLGAYALDELVYVFNQDGVSVLSNTTGEKIWDRNVGYIDYSVRFEKLIYFSVVDKVVCFDPKNRSFLWETPYSAYYGSREYAIKGNILLATDLEHIYALDKNTGKILWQYQLSSPANPTIIEGIIYVMEGFSREIYAFETSTGKYMGKLYSSIPQFLSTDRDDMIASGNLLIFARGNRLFAFGE